MPRSSAFLSRKRWTVTDARRAVALLEASRLPVSTFAARRGISAQRLYVWRRRLAVKGESPTAFVELKAPEPVRVEVELRSGRVLRIPEGFNGAALRELLDVLES
jgi:transposase-like protein